MFFNTEKLRLKRLISWAKENKIDLPKNPDDLKDVTILNLKNKGLDRIPKEIDCLPNLIEINAEMNRLGDLPWEFGALKKLTSINLSHNRFTDIPGAICRLSQVESLHLESNAVKKVPSVIANMTGLKYLNLSFNNIQELPSEISHLKNLKQLEIASNQLSALPLNFFKLHNLISITLWNNKFNGVPEILKELPILSEIQMEADIEKINQQLIKATIADNHFGAERALVNGADINFQYKDPDTNVITCAIFEAKSVEMVRYLIDKGANVNCTRGQETFLTKKHSTEISKYLKSIGLLK